MSNEPKSFSTPNLAGPQDLPAGCFSSWLRRIRYALIKENGVDVRCGDCNACCRSSYFIHIRPEETGTISRINRKLLFPAPGLPKGNVLLGYDEQGHCPMLVDGQCSIYGHRPITCRNYDCRIFPAAGISAGEAEKALITQQIRRWKFSYPTQSDFNQHLAAQAAAKFLQENAGCFPAGFVPGNATQLAILAIKVYDVFLKAENKPNQNRNLSQNEIVKAVMEADEKFSIRRNIQTK